MVDLEGRPTRDVITSSSVMVYSVGKNGLDEGGKGDDNVVDAEYEVVDDDKK